MRRWRCRQGTGADSWRQDPGCTSHYRPVHQEKQGFSPLPPEDGSARECVMVAKIYRDEGGVPLERPKFLRRWSRQVWLSLRPAGATPTVLLRRYVYGPPVLRDVHWTLELARKLGAWLYSCHEALRLAPPQGVGGYGRTRLVGGHESWQFRHRCGAGGRG